MTLKSLALNCLTSGSRSSFHRTFDRLPTHSRDEEAYVGSAGPVARSRSSAPRRAGHARPLRQPSRTVRRATRTTAPWDLLRWIPTNASLPRAMRGLCYRESQTFGIEFELAPKHGEIPCEDSAEWLRVAKAIADALKHRLPTGSFGAVHA